MSEAVSAATIEHTLADVLFHVENGGKLPVWLYPLVEALSILYIFHSFIVYKKLEFWKKCLIKVERLSKIKNIDDDVHVAHICFFILKLQVICIELWQKSIQWLPFVHHYKIT